MATKNKGPIIPNQPVMVGALSPSQTIMAPQVGAQNITTPGWSVRTLPPPDRPPGWSVVMPPPPHGEIMGPYHSPPIIPGQGVMSAAPANRPPMIPEAPLGGPPTPYDPIAAQVSMSRPAGATPTVTQQSADEQGMHEFPKPQWNDPYVALLAGINQRVRDRAGFYQQQIQRMAGDTQLPDAYKAVFQSSAPAIGNAAAGYADALTGSQAVLPHIYDLIDSYRAKVAADAAAAQQKSQDASLSMLEQFANGDTKKK